MENTVNFKNINVSDLEFDYYSSRMPETLNGRSEHGVINFLLLEAATIELMQSIGENGFFRGEQLLVVPTENGKFKVLEGNRRLASVKLLSKPELATVKTISVREVYKSAKYRPQDIPCLIFEKEDEDFYKIRDLDDTTFYIGYLSDSLSYSNISKFIGINLSADNPEGNLDKSNLKRIVHWFFEKNDQNKTRIKGTSSDLNKLNAVLNTEKSNIAYNAFSKGGKDLESAFELTEDIDSLFILNIQKALKYLENADAITHKVNLFYDGLDDELLQIRKLTSKIKQTKDDINKGEYGDDDKF